jgi:UDP-N-acetylmuramyl-tripeptide synthetase
MTVIGITGTDGKTTTSSMIYHFLKKQGIKAGLLTTTHFAWEDYEETNETHKTSLPPAQLNSYLKKMQTAGVTHLVLEVSSHALDQGRLAGIPIFTAVLTNLSHEHLDYHKTMEKYRQAKGILLKKAKNIVIHGDDPFLIPLYDSNKPVLTFGFNADNNILITGPVTTPNGIETGLRFQQKHLTLKLPLFGEHNALNAAACLGACASLGISSEQTLAALESFAGVAGRMERVDIGRPVTVLVDYAVTPQAFQALFKAARQIDKGKLIAVFGACGDRDQAKRPILGKIASEMCDIVIITDEEPYFEDPDTIRQMIAAGIPFGTKSQIFNIPDRKAAINKALELAQDHDVITVSGMGNQTSMVIKDQIVPWSDREEIKIQNSRFKI